MIFEDMRKALSIVSLELCISLLRNLLQYRALATTDLLELF